MELYFFDQLLGLAGHQRLVLQFLQLKGPVNLTKKKKRACKSGFKEVGQMDEKLLLS